MNRRLDIAAIESQARMHGRIVLMVDQDGADFYIEWLENRGHRHNDIGALDDAKSLRRQYELIWETDE